MSGSFLTKLGAYPHTRLRRNRMADWSRRMVAETRVSADNLVWPIFIQEEIVPE